MREFLHNLQERFQQAQDEYKEKHIRQEAEDKEYFGYLNDTEVRKKLALARRDIEGLAGLFMEHDGPDSNFEYQEYWKVGEPKKLFEVCEAIIASSDTREGQSAYKLLREKNDDLQLLEKALQDPDRAYVALESLVILAQSYDHIPEANFPHEQVTRWVLKILERNLPNIALLINSEREFTTSKAFRALDFMVLHGDEKQKTQALEIIKTHAKFLADQVANPFLCSYVGYAIEFLPPEEGDKVLKKINKGLYTADMRRTAEYFTLSHAIVHHNQEVVDRAYKILRERLLELNLDADKMFNRWWASDSTLSRADRIAENFHTVNSLEFSEPGSTETLYKDFNITTFARYPQELLLRQYKEREQKDKSYGIVIMPASDHNGAFYAVKNALKYLYDQNLAYVRIIEAENKIQLGRILTKLNNKYGVIYFAVIGGHGTGNTIRFGDNLTNGKPNPLKMLHKEDFGGKGFRKGANRFFVYQPSFLLLSCYSGAKNGIGKQLTKEYGAHVVATDEATNINTITLSKNDKGDLVLDGEYNSRNSRKSFSADEVK